MGTPTILGSLRDRLHRGSIRWIAMVGLLTGCAGNTAQQDMVYKAWENCRAEGQIAGQVQLGLVEPNGRYSIELLQESRSSYGLGSAQRCMTEQLAKMKQAGGSTN
jgi:hypothetical protein